MRLAGIIIALALATPVDAQDGASPRGIQVVGNGRVSTMPDMAVLHYWITREGKVPDDASKAIAAKVAAVNNGLRGLLQGGVEITNSDLVIIAVRGSGCENGSGYNATPRFDQGTCSIVGYLATLEGTIRMSDVSKAGTAAGVAARLGARDARLQAYELKDRRAAYQMAMQAAIADAKSQAVLIARAADRKLGALLTVRDQNYRVAEDVGTIPVMVPAAPPPPPPLAPVVIDLKPSPIHTDAQVLVSFAIEP